MRSDFSFNHYHPEGKNARRMYSPYKEKTAIMVVKKKITTHLDLLSIPQSGGKNVKRLRGIIGFKYKTSSWHLNGFPYGGNIGSTV